MRRVGSAIPRREAGKSAPSFVNVWLARQTVVKKKGKEQVEIVSALQRVCMGLGVISREWAAYVRVCRVCTYKNENQKLHGIIVVHPIAPSYRIASSSGTESQHQQPESEHRNNESVLLSVIRRWEINTTPPQQQQQPTDPFPLQTSRHVRIASPHLHC